MTQDINVALIRFPHFEGLLNKSIELSDGVTMHVRETADDLGLEEETVGVDVWELPIVRYIAARERGFELTAIPVFATRRFVQWMVEVPEDSDIHEAKDLEGKRIVQSYHGNTDTVWTKGVLEDSYDVDFSGVSWFALRPERVPGVVAPEGVVTLQGAKRDELLLSGAVDAALTSGHGSPPRPGLRLMWADPEGEAAKWYSSTKSFPILHLVVVRDSALAAHPSLARDLYEQFEGAKNDALVEWDYGASLPDDRRAAALWSGFPGSSFGGADRSFLGRDPLPYGLESKKNREPLEQIIGYAVRLGNIQRSHSIEELFAPIDT